MSARKIFIESQINPVKAILRQSALDTWKQLGTSKIKIEDLIESLYRMGATDEDMKAVLEMKEGVMKFRSALDDVIKDFS